MLKLRSEKGSQRTEDREGSGHRPQHLPRELLALTAPSCSSRSPPPLPAPPALRARQNQPGKAIRPWSAGREEEEETLYHGLVLS